MTVAELKMEKIKTKSSALTNLLSEASNMAKSEKREVNELDITKAIYKIIAEDTKDIEAIGDPNSELSTIYSEEIKVLESLKSQFPELPPEPVKLSKDEISKIITETFKENELVKSNRSNIMKLLKNMPDMDMSIANEIISGLLK
jgi:seryl-tRNA synthetase